jgi:uncharacterized membrane protein YraQ (UPF0718 family)/copper chaperone CopZ
MIDRLAHIPADFWTTLMEMAPYLLLGFVAAGAMSVLLPQTWVQKHLGGRRFSTVLKAAALGVPLALCSCSVIPVSAFLRRHGAGRGATVSFLISTPQTGPDSFLVTYGMLGGVFAIFRPILALVSGVVGGGLVSLLAGREEAPSATEATAPASAAAACPVSTGGTITARIRRAFAYGFVTLPEDIGKAIIMGLCIAAVISALVPSDTLSKLVAPGPAQIALLMLAGIPVYVCATASIPIAAALIARGVSPGAALAFLIMGPATNAATVAAVWKLMGRRTTVIYLATIAATAFGGGLLLDQIIGALPGGHTHVHEMFLPPWVQWSSSAILLVTLGSAFIRPLLRHRRVKAAAAAAGSSGGAPGAAGAASLPAITLAVSGMTCNHCRQTVRGALLAVPGVEEVEVDLNGGKAYVRGIDVDANLLRRAVRDAGYGTEEETA